VPVVTVSGHHDVKGVTNIVLNHQRAAELALKHLFHLGHRKIAFIKGQEFSSDTEERWANIERVARRIGLTSTLAWSRNSKAIRLPPTRIHGHQGIARFETGIHRPVRLQRYFRHGSIRALHESGCHVPEDVSVVGFDDIQSAASRIPP